MQPNNNSMFPLLATSANEPDLAKSAHDAYDVYVNEEYLGKKLLLTQNEEIDDIVDFLNVQGIQNVSTHLEGDHYVIKSNEPERIKEIIETYLDNR